MAKWHETLSKHDNLFSSDSISGTSPPSVFVGSYNYPKVFVGPMVPPIHGDTSLLDSPERWKGRSLEDIVNFRLNLVRGIQNISIDQTEGKYVENLQEVVMSSNPIDSDLTFEKSTSSHISLDGENAPFGPIGVINSAKFSGSTSDKSIEKTFYDKDLKAQDAVLKLYRSGIEISKIQKCFSVGMLGQKRKLVPTKWSITAVQDLLGKEVIKQIKQFEPVSDYQVYFGGYLGNYFLVLVFPDVWSFELFEMYMPGSSWNFSGKLEAATNLEWYDGLKGYPTATAGGYFANRLPVVNKLKELKKQASVLVLRFETPSYWASLGCWVVLESMKKTMQSPPSTFESKDAMLDFARKYIKKTLAFDIDPFLKKSKLLEKVKSQSRLQQFF